MPALERSPAAPAAVRCRGSWCDHAGQRPPQGDHVQQAWRGRAAATRLARKRLLADTKEIHDNNSDLSLAINQASSSITAMTPTLSSPHTTRVSHTCATAFETHAHNLCEFRGTCACDVPRRDWPRDTIMPGAVNLIAAALLTAAVAAGFVPLSMRPPRHHRGACTTGDRGCGVRAAATTLQAQCSKWPQLEAQPGRGCAAVGQGTAAWSRPLQPCRWLPQSRAVVEGVVKTATPEIAAVEAARHQWPRGRGRAPVDPARASRSLCSNVRTSQ